MVGPNVLTGRYYICQPARPCPPWTHPAELGPALTGGAFLYERDAHDGRTSTFRETHAEHFIRRAKSGNGTSP